MKNDAFYSDTSCLPALRYVIFADIYMRATMLDIKRVENAFFSLNVHFLSHTSCY